MRGCTGPAEATLRTGAASNDTLGCPRRQRDNGLSTTIVSLDLDLRVATSGYSVDLYIDIVSCNTQMSVSAVMAASAATAYDQAQGGGESESSDLYLLWL